MMIDDCRSTMQMANCQNSNCQNPMRTEVKSVRSESCQKSKLSALARLPSVSQAQRFAALRAARGRRCFASTPSPRAPCRREAQALSSLKLHLALGSHNSPSIEREALHLLQGLRAPQRKVFFARAARARSARSSWFLIPFNSQYS